MNSLVSFSGVHYAVIEGCRSQDSPERFVIAYTDERSLRELIASPSIASLGFDSRTAALRSAGDGFPSMAVSCQRPLRAAITGGAQQCQTGVHAVGRGLADRFRLRQSRTIARRILQRTVVMALLILYSGNLASALIRITLGFPF
jgi:hypothetical protein